MGVSTRLRYPAASTYVTTNTLKTAGTRVLDLISTLLVVQYSKRRLDTTCCESRAYGGYHLPSFDYRFVLVSIFSTGHFSTAARPSCKMGTRLVPSQKLLAWDIPARPFISNNPRLRATSNNTSWFTHRQNLTPSQGVRS